MAMVLALAAIVFLLACVLLTLIKAGRLVFRGLAYLLRGTSAPSIERGPDAYAGPERPLDRRGAW